MVARLAERDLHLPVLDEPKDAGPDRSGTQPGRRAARTRGQRAQPVSFLWQRLRPCAKRFEAASAVANGKRRSASGPFGTVTMPLDYIATEPVFWIHV